MCVRETAILRRRMKLGPTINKMAFVAETAQLFALGAPVNKL
jgi:hypothetical protein